MGSAATGSARPLDAQATDRAAAASIGSADAARLLRASGLTPTQLRARLRAAGYPETLLDELLRSGVSSTTPPRAEVAEALQALGLTDLAAADDLATLQLAARNAGSSRRDTIDAVDLPFGLSFFRESNSLFLPNLDGPVDASYRLGPGDALVLILSGDTELAHTLEITRDGFVVVPDVGTVPLARLTIGDAERLLRTRLARAYPGVGTSENAPTRMTLSVARLRSNQVFVTGDVERPGSYRVSSAGTVLTALYAAGGPTMLGSLRSVQVRRQGRVVGTLDVYDYLLRGDASADVRLEQGDIVFVPVRGASVRLYGGIRRPGWYELASGETLADAVTSAGGLEATAAARRVTIERILPASARRGDGGADRVTLDVSLSAGGVIPSLPLVDGDVVQVPLVADRKRGTISVTGHVWSPGRQGYTSGLTLTDAVRRAGGAQPDAYLPTVHVARLRPDSTRVQLRAALSDTTGATVAPFVLQEDDIITVYAVTDFRPARTVGIAGAVQRGGRYAWRDGMTLRDLLLMAGGPEESAWLREAEIARRPVPATAERTAITLRVVLDSSYRFEQPGASRAAEIPLAPDDHVLILRDPNWRPARAIVLTGEVRYPGTYTLAARDERVSALLSRAGGVTDVADVGGAYFGRRPDAATAATLARTTRQRVSGVSVDSLTRPLPIDSAALTEHLRVGVDLREALARPGSEHDLLLVDGDSIHIPVEQQVVTVRGAVHAPAVLTHSAGRRLGSYISAAGGATDEARARGAYVIQPSGRIEARRYIAWLVPLDPVPRPGATVVVPPRSAPTDRTSALSLVTIVSQLAASLAALIVLTR